MKRYIILFLLFGLTICNSASPISVTDSLKSLLKAASGKERIPILITIMERIEIEDPKSAVKYGEEARDLIKNYPNIALETEILYRTGWAYSYLGDSDSAKYFARLTGTTARSAGYPKGEVMELLLLARVERTEGHHEEALKHTDNAYQKNVSVGDILLEGMLLNEKGSVLRRLSRYDEAFDLHIRALEIFRKLKNDEELRITLTYLGIISDLKARYDEALKYHHEALEISNKLSNKRSAAASIHNIGILYQKIDKYDEALQYYTRALNYWKELNNQDGLASTLNSIGAIHELKGNFNEALNYYNEALKIWEDSGRKFSITIGLHNVGTIYSYLGKYKEASDYLKRSIDLDRELGDKNGIASSLNILSTVYDKLGRKDDAIATAVEGIKIAEEIGNWSTIRHAHHNLGRIYEDNGYYKEALSEYKKYQAANDTIFNSERQQAIAELQEKYKSEEQKKQIEILQKDSEIQSLHRTYLIIGMILLILLILLIYSRYRLKQRAHKALEKLHESEVESFHLKTEAAESKAAMIQVEFDQKTKELNAARTLQLSMLPSIIPSHKSLSIAAAMNTATEVGGDYYDFHKSDNGTFTIAIGDATGHGVKAGIMVTAVKSLFNLLAHEQDLVNILCRSTQAIKKMNMGSLFMAFGLLRIKDNYLESAGAGMPPIYIYRSATSEIENVPLKGLPLGIGLGYDYKKSVTKLNPGDAVVIMSDGFPELFNKEKENLGYEKIPILLKEAGNKSPQEIIDHFNAAAAKWIDGTPQQDDMTFVVLKVSS